MTPSDPTPEALARDPEVKESVQEVRRRIEVYAESFRYNEEVGEALRDLISVILTRYRATTRTSGPVLDFAEARAEAIARSAAGHDTESAAYDAALEAQAAERVAALRTEVERLKGDLFGQRNIADARKADLDKMEERLATAEVNRLRAQRDELRTALRNVIAPPPNTEWADQAIEAQRILARQRTEAP